MDRLQDTYKIKFHGKIQGIIRGYIKENSKGVLST